MTKELLDGWKSKPRTVLRSIKPGDIFCFALDETRYAFGQILSKIFTGHVAVFFDITANAPAALAAELSLDRLLGGPVVIDSYSLFDRKNDGDWRIIGHREITIPAALKDTYFIYGVGSDRKKVDLWDAESPASDSDAARYPILTPRRDPFIRSAVTKLLER